MHELSIALGIVDGVIEEARRRGNVKIDAVHLRLGEYSGVVREALDFAYSMACEGTPLEGSRLVVENVPLAVFCAGCQAERSPVSPVQLSCPDCGAWTPEIVRGRELEIHALELVA